MQTKISLHPDFTIGKIDPRLYGSFIEHLGRAVYGGIYEPGHPRADEDGFRLDTLELIREIGVPIVRYPGGNFVSNFRWEDSVGPVASRPRRLDMAWHAIEPNTFGLHEFMKWCAKAGTEPMMAVNLGTRGPADAVRLLEYCNHPSGTELSDARRRNGAEKPFNIRTWCLGNEMDGPWQAGHKTPEEYARVAAETARLMKQYDNKLELVACGSSNRGMATFGRWESTVLDEAFDSIDLVSLHTYYNKERHDTQSFLSFADDMDDYIAETLAAVDYSAAKRHSRRRVCLSFDEWNVWNNYEQGEDWIVGKPVFEHRYTLEDALLVGGMLIALLNHADRVKVACMAQLVNVIAPIQTRNGGGCWRQSIFHPYLAASVHGRGTAMRAVVQTPVRDTKRREAVPDVNAAAVLHDDGSLALFILNKSQEPTDAAIGLAGFGPFSSASAETLCGDDLAACNTEDDPCRVQPRPLDPASVGLDGPSLSVRLPALSWTVLNLK